MKLTGTPDEIISAVGVRYPEVGEALDRVRERVPFIKREILKHEAAVLYALARDLYGREVETGQILEIGTAWGYSAAVMAEAAPSFNIVTLNPKPAEYLEALGNLSVYGNVTPLLAYSWDYLGLHGYDGRGPACYDLVFVDGDHDRVERDLPWWEHVKPGGLMLFHDYSPDGSGRPCQQVVEVVDGWVAALGLEPDVLVSDARNIGMVGFYK